MRIQWKHKENPPSLQAPLKAQSSSKPPWEDLGLSANNIHEARINPAQFLTIMTQLSKLETSSYVYK